MSNRRDIHSLMESRRPGTLDGEIPAFKPFSVEGASKRHEDIERILRQVDKMGWFQGSLDDQEGREKKYELEEMKKKMAASLKQLVKQSKAFCQKESTSTSHVAAFGFQLQEALFDKNRSMENTAEAMRGLSRIVGNADRSVEFLEERFSKSIQSLNRAFPDILQSLEDLLNARAKLYKKLCAYRDQYDSVLEKARKKRQSKGFLGFGKKKNYDHAPELDEDVVEKRQEMEACQIDFDKLSEHVRQEFYRHERRRESLLTFCIRELVAMLQMKCEIMLTGYSQVRLRWSVSVGGREHLSLSLSLSLFSTHTHTHTHTQTHTRM